MSLYAWANSTDSSLWAVYTEHVKLCLHNNQLSKLLQFLHRPSFPTSFSQNPWKENAAHTVEISSWVQDLMLQQLILCYLGAFSRELGLTPNLIGFHKYWTAALVHVSALPTEVNCKCSFQHYAMESQLYSEWNIIITLSFCMTLGICSGTFQLGAILVMVMGFLYCRGCTTWYYIPYNIPFGAPGRDVHHAVLTIIRYSWEGWHGGAAIGVAASQLPVAQVQYCSVCADFAHSACDCGFLQLPSTSQRCVDWYVD